MAGGGGGEGLSLLYTPTWVVALVCTVIVAISLVVERLLHYAGKVKISYRAVSNRFKFLDELIIISCVFSH